MSGIKASKRIEKSCKHCSASFSVPKHREHTALYCSRRCLGLGSRIQVTRNCAICNTEFSHISSRSNSAKYCSRSCYYKSMTGRGSVEHECAHCGTKFFASPSVERKFCSRACVGKSTKATWLPTFTTVRKAMDARGLIQRCERCGYSECKNILGVHHKDRNRENNKLENLEVLCPNCHSLEHQKHTPHGFSE